MGKIITKVLIYVSIFTLSAIPFMHDMGYYIKLPSFVGFNIIDVSIILLIVIRILQTLKSVELFHLFIIYIIVRFFLSLAYSEDYKLVFYAFRPILYLSVAFLDFRNFNIRSFENILITGVLVYSMISFYILLFNPYLYLESATVEQGRIAFHNDLLLVPVSLVLLYRFIDKDKYKYAYGVLLLLIFLKLVISMSRGLVILYFIMHLYSLILHKKLNIRFALRFGLFAFLLFQLFFYGSHLFSSNHFDLELFFDVLDGRFLGFNESDWQDSHVSSRYPMYWLGLVTAFYNPFFGVGFGTPIYVADWSKYIFFVDSSFISFFMILGLFGSLFFFNYIFNQWRFLKYYLKFGMNKSYARYLPIWIYLIIIFFINSVYVASPFNLVLIVYLSLINLKVLTNISVDIRK